MNCFILFCIFLSGVVGISPQTAENEVKNLPKTDSHNIIQCRDDPDQRILLRKTVSAPARLFLIQERFLLFPTAGIGLETITCLRATDNMQNGKGGYVDILGGGVDFRYVSLRFRSQRSQPLHFSVEIYGIG